MSDYKQPLLGDEASAPPGPPPYNPNLAPPYPTGDSDAAYPPPQAPPPSYPSGPPPPQPANYGTTAQNTTNVTVVQATAAAPVPIIIGVKPPNYIILSVVVLLIFCWLFGLIALISAMQVDSTWASGDHANARRLSTVARGWNIAGMIVGGVLYVIIIVSAIGSASAV